MLYFSHSPTFKNQHLICGVHMKNKSFLKLIWTISLHIKENVICIMKEKRKLTFNTPVIIITLRCYYFCFKTKFFFYKKPFLNFLFFFFLKKKKKGQKFSTNRFVGNFIQLIYKIDMCPLACEKYMLF
jgi:hypothetical protein